MTSETIPKPLAARKLTRAQIEELKHHAPAPIPWVHRDSSWRSAIRPVVASALGRMGLLQSMRQSEHIRGERRTYYTLYHITPAGRAAMEDSNV